jgi:hypothetical protein
MLANQLHPPLTDPLRHLDRVRRDPAELAKLPDRFGVFLEAKIQWSAPILPLEGDTANFRSLVLVMLPPGMDAAPYLSEILSDASRSGIRAVSTFESGPTRASPYPTPVTRTLERVTAAHSPGIPFGPLPTAGGFTTSILFQQRGFPAYGYSPIPMNMFDAARRHGNDERVYLRDYLNGVDLYRDVIEDFAFFAGDKTSGPR